MGEDDDDDSDDMGGVEESAIFSDSISGEDFDEDEIEFSDLEDLDDHFDESNMCSDTNSEAEDWRNDYEAEDGDGARHEADAAETDAEENGHPPSPRRWVPVPSMGNSSGAIIGAGVDRGASVLGNPD